MTATCDTTPARSTRMRARIAAILLAVLFVAGAQPRAAGPGAPPMAQFMSPPYPLELVGARKASRIAWIANDKGRRNVYTAAAPAFTPSRVTEYLKDDGVDLTQLEISDDGGTVVFTRGHTPNRVGWIADPA